MRHNLTYTIDRIEACAFAALAALCIYGAIAKGAWWHIGTAVICAVMAVTLWTDDIVDEDDIDLE
jgi:hypothetical protein